MGEAAGSVPCRAPALQTKVFKYREGVLGAQPLLQARAAARHHGHPQRHPLPGLPGGPTAHPAAPGRRHHGAAPQRRRLRAVHLLPHL
uniref:Intracellular interleukin-1 receptor antagonist n=1 Tax=Gallus gallus TaxID=9031 RepID=H2A078_CHICK|nr:intracellular interleukin-1 receptor antagonist [Gallus gallus]